MQRIRIPLTKKARLLIFSERYEGENVTSGGDADEESKADC
ncbi:hypothetical protein UF75_3246 [Desulfosporosinus sp. I2]|nr:hypothetical protein UF75_3246 [Desulfosporosinus sp. I2]